MKEIGIAKTIVKRRHEMGLTQDELAISLGVTKASVSKWETGLSYPDILMLPKLASFFNVSIDELLNYTPQLSHQDITKLYKQLADDFAEKPFDEVYEECESLIKKYYSCFPFLLQMCVLYINHYPMAGSGEASAKIIREICDLCNRIKTECNEAALISETISIEALAHLILSQLYAGTNPELMKQELGIIFDLLGKDIKPPLGNSEVLINAYQLQGNNEKAKQLCQVHMYNNLMSLLSSFPRFMTLYQDQPERLDEITNRCMKLLEVFQVENLSPNTAACCFYQSASAYMMLQNKEAALQMLNKYSKACIRLFENMTLHGDSFFDQLDSWFENYDLGIQPPRSRQLVYDSIISSLGPESIFAPLVNEKEMKEMITQLRRIIKC
ncbi:MAG TPA: helix-turn-helix transcriptional regulator [Lachnospiraceae bacterium]|nr:helix-turn-helix transcriptional regulator [Lachnospiraceae bacterium]